MDFPINQALLDETSALKDERRIVRERLQKVEENRSQVSEAVYQRVHADYEIKLRTLGDALLAKKQTVDRELAVLYEARGKVGANVNVHAEQLEEIRFRHSLGEFSEKDFQEQANLVGDKLEKFETLLAALEQNIARYESLFSDEPDLLPDGPLPVRAVQRTLIVAESIPEYTPLVREVPLAEALEDVEESGTIALPPEPEDPYQLNASGGDYFTPKPQPALQPDAPSNGLETRVFKMQEPDSVTMANIPAPAVRAMLSVVQGSNVGATYPMQTETTIGRSSGNTIIIKEAKISRQHAVIRHAGNTWTIADLHSSNGIFVNGARVTETILQAGDQLQIGDVVMEVCLGNLE